MVVEGFRTLEKEIFMSEIVPGQPGDEKDPSSGKAKTASSEGKRSLGEVDKSFYLIGIGASAGGLEAIKQLIAQVPDDFPHSFVIIQHLSPDYKSLMSEILGRETRLTVQEVADDMAIRPRFIYLIPPRSNVVIQGTDEDNRPRDPAAVQHAPAEGLRFSLVEPSPRPQLNLPIDLFFQSLAEAVGNRAVAIVLSGTGSDGSRGLRAVKDRDGFVMVQDPETAGFDGMPRAALATKIVDSVGAPDALIGELQRYFDIRESGIENVEDLFKGSDTEFAEMLELISETAEIDFTQYKEPTLKRRVARRMGLRQCEKLADYLKILHEEPSEVATVYREFLVGVTNFFRDLPAWRILEKEALPRIFEEGDTSEPVKIWSVGCSTGEEAYTAALLCHAYCKRNDIKRGFRIFATDVNDNAVASARDGTYPMSVAEEIPEEFRNKDYMRFSNGTFQFSSDIRQSIVFAPHNVLDDAPYVRTDLIICRNLLIYFSAEMQSKTMSVFSFSLRQGGYLFLGAAENIGRSTLGFEAIRGPARLFQNARKLASMSPRAGGAVNYPLPRQQFGLPRARRLATREEGRHGNSLARLFPSLLSNLNVAVFITSESGHIVETYGEYRDYIAMPDEAFSSNLVDLAEDRLKSAISLLMRRALTEGQSDKPGIQLVRDDETRVIDLHCEKIEWESHPTAYSVTISQARQEPSVRAEAGFAEAGADFKIDPGQRAYIHELESEIESLQELLSATSEDLGVSNEELQTTNEELTASNEELQASNEEMQSINEELHTINAENAEKIQQLEEANDDINNLLTTAELAIIVLDDKLRIRRINDAVLRYVDLTPGDTGRPLSSFSAYLQDGAINRLLDDAALAVRNGEETVRDVVTANGDHAVVRVRPFVTNDEIVDGAVITFLDTTKIVDLQAEVADQRDRLEGLLESEAAGYWDWNIPEHTEFMSPRFKSMFGYEEHEIEDTPDAWMKLIHPDDLPGVLENFELHVKSKGHVPYDNEVRYHHKDGSIVWVLCRGRVIEWDKDGAPVRMMGVHLDITPLKTREDEIRRKAEEIRRFAFIAAHDLVQPMNMIQGSLEMLIEDIDEETAKEQSEKIDYLEVATERMKRRISGILEYARLTEQTFEPQTVDLDALANEAVSDLSEIIETAGAEISIAPLGKAIGAPSLIERIFLNLIGNSLKYCSPDRPCKIEVSRASAPKGMVGIRIADNGRGIPRDQHESIFRLFSRLHSEDEIAGTGIGLALCERIIQLHKGTIRIEDVTQPGASFVFALQETVD